MVRLIDADILLGYVNKYDKGQPVGKALRAMLEKSPTVDAEPVIHCKDCKWYYRGGATCMYWDGANSGDDFCSRAERREE